MHLRVLVLISDVEPKSGKLIAAAGKESYFVLLDAGIKESHISEDK